MAYLNNDRHHPGYLDSKTAFDVFNENLAQVAGKGAGQTEFDEEAPFSFQDWIESKHATHFDQVKDADPTLFYEAFRQLFEYESHAQTGFPMPSSNEIRAMLGGSGSQYLGSLIFGRESPGNGTLQLLAILAGVATGTLIVTPDGWVAVNSLTAEYELDVPSGEINVSGDYRRLGVIIPDWTETLGAPNKLSTALNAALTLATGVMKTTLATSTAPWTASSTTLCPGVDADLFEGLAWHPGFMASGSATYAAADTQIVAQVIDRAGVWWCRAVFTVYADPADNGLGIDCKLKDGAGTQIGQTGDFTAKKITVGGYDATTYTSVEVFGSYTAAVGNETIKAMVGVPTGTGSLAEATLTLAWQKP